MTPSSPRNANSFLKMGAAGTSIVGRECTELAGRIRRWSLLQRIYFPAAACNVATGAQHPVKSGISGSTAAARGLLPQHESAPQWLQWSKTMGSKVQGEGDYKSARHYNDETKK